MDGTFDELLVFAAKQVNGRQKRSIFAAVCEKHCDGSSRKTEERFGWSREAVAKGLLERSGEPEEEVRFQRGGVKPSERTLRDILNRMNYRLKRIQKGKPLKKTENTTPVFENLDSARNEAKAESTTLEVSVDTKSKVATPQDSTTANLSG